MGVEEEPIHMTARMPGLLWGIVTWCCGDGQSFCHFIAKNSLLKFEKLADFSLLEHL
jgi:hypothetical protein